MTSEAVRPLILIVDDFEDNRELYASYLAHFGYRVAQASHGREALQQAFDLGPDLVVMDLALPGLDGWEATRLLRVDPRTRGTPVIALSGHSLEDYARRAHEAGCDKFMMKPCLPETLLEEIKGMLGERPTARR